MLKYILFATHTLLIFTSAQAGVNCYQIIKEIQKVESPILLERLHGSIEQKLFLHIFPKREEDELKALPNIEAFQKFLNHYQLNWNDFDIYKKRAIALTYLNEEIESLKNITKNNLDSLREKELKRSLLNHGIEDFNGSSTEKLKEISQRNLERISKKFRYQDEVLDESLRDFISKIQLQPIHNSHIVKSEFYSPILSSMMIQEILGSGGFNTAHFNREVMQSDGNIFFFADFKNQKSSDHLKVKKYGKNKMTIKEEPLYQKGWISPFVMYQDELMTYGNSVRDRSITLDLSYEEKILYFKDLLHLYDFTPNDYETLVKMTLTEWVIGLRKAGHYRYKVFQENPQRLIDEIQTAFKEALGVSFRFEFKVPVLIPISEQIFI